MRPRLLMVFVDGLGLGVADPAVNPVHSGACPQLEALLRDEAAPLDACLGVPGVPQSATGQTALLTGVNAPRHMGRHVEGFPGPELRAIVSEHNLFRQLAARGLSATFANAYFVADSDEVRTWRTQSVTTVAALSAFGRIRDRAALERNAAVYHDLTRLSLRPRGYSGPLLRPAQSAEHLLALAADYDFTLFEYFLTDRVGHARQPEAARAVLAELDEFLGVLRGSVGVDGLGLILTSDHGNVEDLTVAGHTCNPVPLVGIGGRLAALRATARSLLEVPGIVLEALAG